MSGSTGSVHGDGATATTLTPFERIGGAPALRLAVDRFYTAVYNDADLSPYFDGVDLGKLKGHQASLLTKLLGGPDGYAGRDLAAAHRGLGITDEHYDRVSAYLVAVLTGLDVPADIVASLGDTLEEVRTQIVAAPSRTG